jgi:hypothetical protein
MTKKDFIALADMIRAHNMACKHPVAIHSTAFTPDQLDALADFCRSQNSEFKRDRWLGYVAGENGPSGGTVRSKPHTGGTKCPCDDCTASRGGKR